MRDDPARRATIASENTPAGTRRLVAEHALLASRLAGLRVQMLARFAGQTPPRDLHGRTPITRLCEIETLLVEIGDALDDAIATHAAARFSERTTARLGDRLTDVRLSLERMEAGFERRQARNRSGR
ncbi:MAG: hypothetical protein R3E87_13570 [Burkholderiaceae bacterium]